MVESIIYKIPFKEVTVKIIKELHDRVSKVGDICFVIFPCKTNNFVLCSDQAQQQTNYSTANIDGIVEESDSAI